MGESAKFFKRQSGQMRAVVAEAMEALEATKEVIAQIKSDPPGALTLPPPPPQAIPNSSRRVDTGRYAVLRPAGTVPPSPPAPQARPVPRPIPTAPKPPPEEDVTENVSRVRAVSPKAPQGLQVKPTTQIPRPAMRPLPPPLPRQKAASDDDE